jgi:hypothetical protein
MGGCPAPERPGSRHRPPSARGRRGAERSDRLARYRRRRHGARTPGRG